MKLPRDLAGTKLADALIRFGYRFDRQRGSHLHLSTAHHGEHHIVVPAHRPLKIGTLTHLLRDVAEHHGITREELINTLRL